MCGGSGDVARSHWLRAARHPWRSGARGHQLFSRRSRSPILDGGLGTGFNKMAVVESSSIITLPDGAPIALRGYGPQCEILDCHGLISTLLEPDLCRLESQVNVAGLARLRQGVVPLSDALTGLLASAVNLHCAGSSAAASGGNTLHSEAALVGGNRVTDSYLRRLELAAAKAMPSRTTVAGPSPFGAVTWRQDR